MSPRNRRLLAAGVAAAVVAVVVAASRPGDPPTVSFRVVLGLKDKEPTDWSGHAAVADGEAVGLKGWRFEDTDAVEGTAKWTCKTRNYIVPGDRFPQDLATGKPPPPPQEPWPNGVVLALKGAGPAVTLTLPAGEVKFKADDVPLGQPKTFLDGRVRVERLPATTELRPPAEAKDPAPVQDDYPAFWVRYKTGKQYLAWIAYQSGKDRVLLTERDGPDGAWSDPLEVAGPGDHFRVALAGTHDDTLWVVWSSQRDHNWDLYGRPYKGGKLGDEVRLSDAPGPDIWHRMTTDQRGRAWLVWQGARDGKFAIFARCAEGVRWKPAIQVSDSKADCWNPVVCHDYKEDRVWVAWDSYESKAYNIVVTSLSGGPDPKHGPFQPPGQLTVALQGPVFARAPRERVDDREISWRRRRAGDAWNGNAAASCLLQEEIRGMDLFASWRQRIQEPDGHSELAHLGAKLLAVRAVPGDNRIKRPQ